MSATLNLIKAFNTLYNNRLGGGPPPAAAPAPQPIPLPFPPDSLNGLKEPKAPIIDRWTFPGMGNDNDLGYFRFPLTNDDDYNERTFVPQFISMPDGGVIENCIGFHWYDLMFNVKTIPERSMVESVPTDNSVLSAQKYPPYHLIFAYLLENSRIIPIFERVIFKFMSGEDLGHPSPFTAHWIRNTQSLFYKDSHIPNFRSLNSSLLPSADANRRNAYFRLFGLELHHNNQDNSPIGFTKPVHANLNFVPLLENLLREIWQGTINHRNTSGANTTDIVALADMAKLLKDSLLARRNAEMNLALYESSNLSKEEFFSVIMLEWFYQAIATNNDLVKDMNAESITADERLAKIGKHVGITPHSKTRDLFALAPLLAAFLRLIEEGFYDNPQNISALFDPNIPESFAREISLIITLWQKTTGRNLKQMPNSPYALNGNGQRVSQAVVVK
jgi:hypothetical protein